MTNKTLELTESVYQYILQNGLREPDVMRELREKTALLPTAQMQISPEQAQLMRFLVELTQAKRALELGVFTGYSALAVALGLPEDGQMIALDINPEWTDIGKAFWQKAKVAHKISLKLGPALESLEQLLADPSQRNSFDFIFIDADKANYPHYYEKCLLLLRPGGLMMLDNMLRGGAVADPKVTNQATQAIRNLNAQIVKDARVKMCLLPLSDGISLVQKCR